MIVTVALAIGLAMRVEPRRLALLGAAVHLPSVVAVLVLVHWLRSRSGRRDESALFCEGVAAELRAGASLRHSLTTAALAVGAPIEWNEVQPSAPIADVARVIAAAFPSIERELRLTVLAAVRAGSDAAGLFDEIGSLAIAQAEVRREVSIATAPGKATAAVLVGFPMVYLLTQLGSTGIGDYLASSQQRLTAGVGFGLFSVGLAAALFVLWKAAR